MSNPTELLDLDRLEALAHAATPGPWVYQEDSDAYTHIVRPAQSPGRIVRHYAQDTSGVVEANARFTAAANPAAVLALIALARRPPVPAQRPTDDELWDSTIRDRDTYHEWADKLAGAIAVHFGVDIGEHSNQNCPWHEALEAIESAEPARRAQPEGEAPQAVAPKRLEGREIFEIAAPYFVWNAPSWHKATQAAVGMTGLLAFAEALLKAAPAAQHADSGAPAGTGRQLMDQWTGAAKALEERATQAAAVKPWQQRVAESGKRECADLAVDCLMAEVAELRVLLKRPMLDEDAYLAAQSQGAQAGSLGALIVEMEASGATGWAYRLTQVIAAQQTAAPGALEVAEAHVLLSKYCVGETENGQPVPLARRISELYSWYYAACQPDDESMSAPGTPEAPFQARVEPWMAACFGPRISADTTERNHRFIEEALELVQAGGMPKADVLQLVDYTYGRPIGELHQEVGGVMVTLAALCLAQGLDMHQAAEVELARIWTKVEAIREKQRTKPRGSPLPMDPRAAQLDGGQGEGEKA